MNVLVLENHHGSTRKICFESNRLVFVDFYVCTCICLGTFLQKPGWTGLFWFTRSCNFWSHIHRRGRKQTSRYQQSCMLYLLMFLIWSLINSFRRNSPSVCIFDRIQSFRKTLIMNKKRVIFSSTIFARFDPVWLFLFSNQKLPFRVFCSSKWHKKQPEKTLAYLCCI